MSKFKNPWAKGGEHHPEGVVEDRVTKKNDLLDLELINGDAIINDQNSNLANISFYNQKISNKDLGDSRVNANYYNDDGSLFKRNPSHVERFFVQHKPGTLNKFGLRWIEGLSYQSLFGDENEKKATKFTNILPISNFLDGESMQRVTSNSWYLQFGDPTETILKFWYGSRGYGPYDYKNADNSGLSLEDAKKTDVVNVGDILVNRHEAGMFLWGFAAGRAYAGLWDTAYLTLMRHNKKMHLLVEGNEDEWGEVFSWTWGFILSKNHGKYYEGIHGNINLAMRYYYQENQYYKSIEYPYGALKDKPLPPEGVWEDYKKWKAYVNAIF